MTHMMLNVSKFLPGNMSIYPSPSYWNSYSIDLVYNLHRLVVQLYCKVASVWTIVKQRVGGAASITIRKDDQRHPLLRYSSCAFLYQLFAFSYPSDEVYHNLFKDMCVHVRPERLCAFSHHDYFL